MILTSSVRAQEWFQISSGTNKKLNTIHFPTSTVGYIGGNDSLLLKTIDGGQNWAPITYSGVTFYPDGDHILNLQFLTEDVGFMTVGPYSGSYKTVDGGSTWTSITDLTTCFNEGLYFFDENNGFIGGSGCFQGEKMNKLTAGVWSEPIINTPTWSAENRIVDYDFFDSNYGLAASRSGYILRTTDGGNNWDTIPTPGTAVNPLTSVLIVDNNLAYAGYESIGVGFGLYISTDNGLTWQEDLNSATFLYPDFHCLHQDGNGTIYSGGNSSSMSDGVIFESPNDPLIWTYYAVDQQINDLSSYNDSIVFAVGDSGYIVVNKDFSIASIDQHDEFDILLFPNPVHSVLTLGLPAETEVIWKIISTTGQTMLVMENQKTVDLTSLSSGIYIIEITIGQSSIRKSIIKN